MNIKSKEKKSGVKPGNNLKIEKFYLGLVFYSVAVMLSICSKLRKMKQNFPE